MKDHPAPTPCLEVTEDTLAGYGLSVKQPREGYRFSLDSLLLAHFAGPHTQGRVMDLGAGCGVVSLLLAVTHPEARLLALEIQPELCRLARENAAANGLEGRLSVREGDLRRVREEYEPERCDLVVCNPPYLKAGAGRRSPSEGRAVARHEITATCADVAEAARFLLKRGGWLVLVYPAARLAHLLWTLRQSRMEPKRLRLVHPDAVSVGRLALAAAQKEGGEELALEPPLLVYEEDGRYTPEAAAILRVRPEASQRKRRTRA